MSALIFLAIPVVIIAIGVVVLWVRHRKPTSVESGVEAFQREMRALSPEGPPRASRRSSLPGSVPRDDDPSRRT